MFVGIAVLLGMAVLGDALTTTLVDQHPLALMALNSRNRILVLTSNQVDPVSFYLVAGFRLVISDPLYFVLGRWYGDASVAWLERRSPRSGLLVRRLERRFGPTSYPLLAVMPNPMICLLAGASGMAVASFWWVNIAGTAVRLYLLRRLGEAFAGPIDDIVGFFAEHRLQLLAVSVLLVGVPLLRAHRRGRGELAAVAALPELEDT